MKNVTSEQVEAALKAYFRATGIAANRAGMRAALYAIDVEERRAPETNNPTKGTL